MALCFCKWPLIFVNFIYILLREGPLAHLDGPSLHKSRVFPEVLMTPHICIDSWAKSAQGWIQGGAKIGPGGSLLQRTSSSDRKATATFWMHSSDLEAFWKKYCYFWFHWEVKFWRVLDVFLDLVILVYFNAISIDFCAIKSLSALILCNFHLYKWEDA